jgi:ornithine decarboxylase
MADLGLGFDSASLSEIQLVLVFSHPCKAVLTLRMASSCGIWLATFGNADELDKIRNVSPSMRLLLRIYAQDDTARASLGKKFGAGPL